jgi:hypothetical protein
MAKKKSKSMRSKSGGRKLATGAGRRKQKSGGEAQKPATEHGLGRRTGSSRQRRG